VSAIEAVSSIPAASVMSLRRPVLISAGIGVIGLVASGLLGHILMGVLGCVGLALGLLNVRLLQRQVAKATITETPNKKGLAMSAAGRLLVITAIALGCGFFIRPDGIGVFLGLAAFQMMITASTAGSVARGLRQQ